MGRPSKLSPEQWVEAERRLAAGEGASALSREYGVHPSQFTRRLAQKSQKVREVAQKVAIAQAALAELPIAQQYSAINLAETLRSISGSLAATAELGAKTSHRLAALANTEAAKIDDADPSSPKAEQALRAVALLTKVANEAAATGMGLIAANKGMPPPDDPSAPGAVTRIELVPMVKRVDAAG